MKMGLASKVYGHKKNAENRSYPLLQKNAKGHSISERKLNEKKTFLRKKRNDLKVDYDEN